MSADRLNILSFGAGALGTYIGGSLALHGHRVVFLEQPPVADILSRQGLKLKLDQETTNHIPDPEVTDNLEKALQLGPFDVALFALKSFDTPAVIEAMRPHRSALPPVLCLQNGVENETALAGMLGDDMVIAGTVTSAIGRSALGDIQLERLRGMGIAADHSLSQALVEACIDAGLNARLYARAMDMKWSKMLTNLMANASSAILDLPPAQIFAHPGLYRLEVDQLREALRVMDAYHFQVVDLPGTPVRALAFAVRNLPSGLTRNLLKNAIGGGRGAKMPSFHIDLHSGRGQSEVDYLNGAVVRYGEQAGIPTPVNRLLNETLQAMVRGEIPLNAFAHQPEKLLIAYQH